MPADLAALDALCAAATPGPWDIAAQIGPCDIPTGRWLVNGDSVSVLVAAPTPAVAKANAALIAALHNAWPSLKRRLVIGDAAVEVLEADHDLDRVMESCGDVMPGLAQQRYNRLSAARARLRALREESDA